MYERFTDRARKVMQLANQEAQRFNHEYIGTEHILLGLVKEGSGVAANVLKNLDIDLRKIRLEVEKIVQHGPGGGEPFKGRLPQTPRAQKVIEYAISEARGLNHNYVGTEHLLLGLLREEEGVAAQVLMNLGLKLEDVREEVLNLLGHNLPNDVPPGGVYKLPLPGAKDTGVIQHAKRKTEGVDGPNGSGARPDDTPVPPVRLTDDQLRAVRERIRYLREQKELFVAVQDFEQAARLREELVALTQLLAWYEWFLNYP
jgi:hypothetical protein